MVEKRVEQQLHTSQMSDEAVNVEFLEWLKLWGPRIFIAACFAVIIFRLSIMWNQSVEDRMSEAWRDLANTESVAGLLAVGDDHGSVGSIAELAWLRAASLHYQTVLEDEPVNDEADALNEDALTDPLDDADSEPGSEDEADSESSNESEDSEADEDASEEPTAVRMSEEERADLLQKMQDLYQRVMDSTAGVPAKEVFRIRALFGLAAVAEMRLDKESARLRYEEAEELCRGRYDRLEEIAKKRIAGMDRWVMPIEILTDDEVKKIEEANTVPDLLLRPEDEEAASTDDDPATGDDQPAVDADESNEDKSSENDDAGEGGDADDGDESGSDGDG